MSRRAGGLPGTARPLEPVHAGMPGPDAELFIVEGESAALAVARVRDRERQGLVPMQGKPLNALRATRRRVLAQPFYRALADALGAPLGEPSDPRSLRYGRLLILTDPDADGIHCGVLLLGFLLEWMRPLLDAGMVAWVRAPWGVVEPAGGAARVVHSEEELVAAVAAARAAGPVAARRFRGLAALDDVLLRATCLAPATRRIERVDAAAVAGMLRTLASLDGIPGPVPDPDDPRANPRADRP